MVRALGVKISIEQIGISMEMFSVIAVFFASNYGKQIIFLHNAKYSFRILMYPLPFEPYMHSAVSVCTVAMFLTFPNFLGKRKIPGRRSYSFDIVIVAAP